MTRSALRDVLFLLTTTLMYVLRRDPHRLGGYERRIRELVTSIAVRRDWFLRFPVTVETRSVIFWCGFERRGPRPMTDGAVVVTLRRVCETQESDRVLVSIVWKLDRELELR